MNFEIDRINESNYFLFDDMVFWRENEFEREPTKIQIAEQIKRELDNPNLYVYAAMSVNRYVAWISLIYLPKVGRWKGHGHIYVDELSRKLEATGIRLYVNVNNPIAKSLYESCGYNEDGQAYFMEK